MPTVADWLVYSWQDKVAERYAPGLVKDVSKEEIRAYFEVARRVLDVKPGLGFVWKPPLPEGLPRYPTATLMALHYNNSETGERAIWVFHPWKLCVLHEMVHDLVVDDDGHHGPAFVSALINAFVEMHDLDRTDLEALAEQRGVAWRA